MNLRPETLVLLDIHPPVAPPWWPPAPGWWIVAGIALLALAIAAWIVARRRRRRRAIERLFDEAMRAAATPAARIAAMSELLRRAARRHERDADRLQGDAWLQFLDAGSKQPLFVVPEHGRLLLEGGFRREIDNEAVDALQPQMRARFLALMQRPHKRPTSVRRSVGSKASSP